MGVTARACAGRLQEISNYLEYFPGPNKNVPLTEGDLINILNQIVPAQWRRVMISINFQLFNKSINEVIEYMEKLEALRPLTSSQVSRKMTRKSQKIRLVSLKTRLRNFLRNILNPKAKRERIMTLTLTLTLRMTGMASAVLYVIPKEGHYGLTTLKTAELLRDSRKKKQRATHGMTKKEFHALVNNH